MNSHNENDTSPLYDAIINQQWKIAQLLIESKAQLSNDSWPHRYKKVIPNILHYAIRDHNVEESFIDFLLSSSTPNESTTIHIEQTNDELDGCTPILSAARYGNLRILKHLINHHKPNVHAKSTFNGHNLFHCAVLLKDKCTIELLDTIHLLGIDINAFDQADNDFNRVATPLTLAIYHGLSFEIIKRLVELGADIITTDDRKYNPDGDEATYPLVQSHLFKAIQLKDDDYKIFNYLVEQCPNSSTIPFKSILKEEFVLGNIDSIKLIIEKYRIQFDDGQYTVDLFESLFGRFPTIVSLFESPQFPIEVKMIEYLLGQNVQNCFNFDSTNRFFNRQATPLLLLTAYSQSSLKLFQLMVQNGANVNDVGDDRDGYGVLQNLCNFHENTTAEDIIQKIDYFINMGADVNYNFRPTKKENVSTALHIATKNKQFSSILVPHLVQHHNADITLTNSTKHVPLHHVTEPELIPLLASPSTINHQGNDESTPLLLLLQHPHTFNSDDNKYFQIISKLIEYGANVNIPNKVHDYPIDVIFGYLFKLQPMNVIELIIKQHYIHLNTQSRLHKLTPLQLAIQQFIQPDDSFHEYTDSIRYEIRLKAIQSIQLLLQYNSTITIRIPSRHTLLHYIVRNGLFPRKGFDINQIDYDLVEDFMVTIIDGIIDQTINNNPTIHFR